MRSLDLPNTSASLTSDYFVQEKIYAADDGHDYRVECEKSGEPLIASMKPQDEQAHHYPLERSMAKIIIGEPQHLSAYEVRFVALHTKH